MSEDLRSSSYLDDLHLLVENLKSSEENLHDLDVEFTPIITRFKTILFSQHENSVKIIKNHQCLVNLVLLLLEKIKIENKKLEQELTLLIKQNTNKINLIYQRFGNSMIAKPSYEIRKNHEIRLYNNLRELECLKVKLIFLQMVFYEEKEKAKKRIFNLQKVYSRNKE